MLELLPQNIKTVIKLFSVCQNFMEMILKEKRITDFKNIQPLFFQRFFFSLIPSLSSSLSIPIAYTLGHLILSYILMLQTLHLMYFLLCFIFDTFYCYLVQITRLLCNISIPLISSSIYFSVVTFRSWISFFSYILSICLRF